MKSPTGERKKPADDFQQKERILRTELKNERRSDRKNKGPAQQICSLERSHHTYPLGRNGMSIKDLDGKGYY